MANSALNQPIFVPSVATKVQFFDTVIENFAAIETTEFRRWAVVYYKQQAKREARRTLSKISGPKGPHHRPNRQPGRTGDYDKRFTVRTTFSPKKGITLAFGNSSSYAEIVERGTDRRNYRIPLTRDPKSFLHFYHYGFGEWRFVRKSVGVIHPGPWRSGTANPNGRSGDLALGEAPGFGGYVINTAGRHSFQMALLQVDRINRARARASRIR